MIRLAVLILGFACSLPAAAGRWMTYQATAYTTEGETKDGHITREGRTVAADSANIPMGSRIQVRNAGQYSGTYTVQDTGRKVVGRHIDFYIEDNAEAKRFGKKVIQVRILTSGSRQPATKSGR